jgi:hypothetical protein
MKKRILVLLSVVALMMASVSPAFATPQTVTANCFDPSSGFSLTLIDVKKNVVKKYEKDGYICRIVLPPPS